MTKPNGTIVWEGASLLDGQPIALLLTGLATPSKNIKTGDMIQSYIIRQDIAPITAVVEGEDSSVCGNCPLRRSVCYVDLRPVNSVWRKYSEGGYPHINNSIKASLSGRLLRVSTYGDATAVPFEVWEDLMNYCQFGTGYTHQWRDCDQRWRSYLMASVESAELAEEARSLGWRTFRVALADELPGKGEIFCRNHEDSSITCDACGLCNGARVKSPSIINPVHGLAWKSKNFEQLRATVSV